MATDPQIDPDQFGVSFSLKQCRNLDIDPIKTLHWLIHDAGFQRFRLMSYWNEHEETSGAYDFSALDAQIAMVEKSGGVITLCLGVRQPRWPENHWPEWAWVMDANDRTEALLRYISAVVERYKDRKCIVSWQLENEALLKNFGKRSDVNRQRLRAEYQLVKQLDPSRSIIMTTSTSWGIPLRAPIPKIVGFSYYHTLFNKGAYRKSTIFPWYHRFRKGLIRVLHNRSVFIHELQLEPWGPANIWEMSPAEQDRSMSTEHIAKNIRLGRAIHAAPIDLWGGEWWYWRLKHEHDPSIWRAVSSAIHDKTTK